MWLASEGPARGAHPLKKEVGMLEAMTTGTRGRVYREGDTAGGRDFGRVAIPHVVMLNVIQHPDAQCRATCRSVAYLDPGSSPG